MSAVSERYYTPEEYLAFERGCEYRNEYVDGRIRAVPPSNLRHSRIGGNIAFGLHTRFRGLPCDVFKSAMRTKVSQTSLYAYPDVVALCGPLELEDEYHDTLLNPTVIVEVLSPSTEAYDRGEKFAHYRRIPSLREYVLVAQDRARVEHYARLGERWVLTVAEGLDAELMLPALDCALPLRELYERVAPFAHEPPLHSDVRPRG